VDPICGKAVSKNSLIRTPAIDVPKLIAAYNNSGEREDDGKTPKGNNQADGEEE